MLHTPALRRPLPPSLSKSPLRDATGAFLTGPALRFRSGRLPRLAGPSGGLSARTDGLNAKIAVDLVRAESSLQVLLQRKGHDKEVLALAERIKATLSTARDALRPSTGRCDPVHRSTLALRLKQQRLLLQEASRTATLIAATVADALLA